MHYFFILYHLFLLCLQISSLEGQCDDHKKCIEQLKEQIQDKTLQCDQLSKEKGMIVTGHNIICTHILHYTSPCTSAGVHTTLALSQGHFLHRQRSGMCLIAKNFCWTKNFAKSSYLCYI